AFTPDSKIVLVGTTKAGVLAVVRYLGASASTLTANQLYVSKLYLDLLQRPVDSSGLASWTTMLDKGGSRAQVVAGIQNSPEYHVAEVQPLYGSVLQRVAEPAAVSHWAGFLDQGGTVEQLEAILLGSDEYFNRFGHGTRDGFLQALYQLVLHRPA